MGLIDEILSTGGSYTPGSRMKALMLARRRESARRLDKRANLLAQPDLLEKRVAAHASTFSLSTRRARTRRWQSKIDALEEQAKGTPQEGFASELLQSYTAALSDPNYLGKSNRQLLSAVSQGLMRRQPEGEGSSRFEQAYRHKWRADTSLGNLFGVFGRDKDVRALPGYEKYLEEQKAKPIDKWDTGPGEAALYGGGFTAALMLGSRVIGRTAMMAPIPGGRIVGAALMAIPEFMAFDAVHNVLAKTEWYRAREGTYRKYGADLLAGGVVIGGGYKAITLSLKKAAEKGVLSKVATDILKKSPTAKRAIEAGEAQRVAKAAVKDVDAAMKAGISKEDVYKAFREMEGLRQWRAVEAARVSDVVGRSTLKRAVAKAAVPKAGVKTGAETGKGLVDSILTASGEPRYAGEFEVGKMFVKLSEKDANRALKNAGKKGTKESVIEQARLAELEKELAKTEGAYLEALGKKEGELESTYLARLEEREAALTEKLAGTRGKKKAAQTKVQEAIGKTVAGKTISKADRLKLLEERGAAKAAGKKEADTAVAKAISDEELASVEKVIAEDNRQTISLVEAGLEEAGEGFVEEIRESRKNLTDLFKIGIGIFGTGAVALGWPEEAEAGVIDKTLIRVGKKALKGVKKAKPKAKPKAWATLLPGEQEMPGGGSIKLYNIEGVHPRAKSTVSEETVKKLGLPILKAVAGAGLFGSIALADLFGPREAEAAFPLPQALRATGATISRLVAKTAEGSTEKKILGYAKEWMEGNLLHVPIAAGAKEVNYFQESFRLAPQAAKKYGDLIKNVSGKRVSKWLVKWGSPYWSGSELLKMSPVPEMGNVMSVIGHNASNGLRATHNILNDVPGLRKGAIKATKDIIDATGSIAEKYHADVQAYRALKYEEDILGGVFEKLHKAVSSEKGISLTRTERKFVAELFGKPKFKGRLAGTKFERALAEIEKRQASWEVAEGELRPAFEAFKRDHRQVIEPLAKKYSTTRIALAVEDTPSYTRYPFLKEIMTPEEEEAAVWLRKLHKTYRGRLEEAGHQVIAGPYIHHAWHPKWSEAAAAKRIKDFGISANAVPYSKFFHRAKFSEQMIPDINYIMPKYLMDTERRLQWSKFWGKGMKDSWYSHRKWVYKYGPEDLQAFWRKVTASIVPPSPSKWNQMANIYSSFEVARLLAGSGSVPLKHYFKVIGTMATIGLKPFASHYGESLEQAFRSAKNAPEVLTLAKKVGIKIPETPQGRKKLINEIINSFIGQQQTMNTIADLDFESLIPNQPGFWQAATKKLQTFNRWGSIPVRAIEALDRHHTVLASLDMAAKKGMTAQQALYATYGNILKVNFLSGAANPAWIRNPKIRSMMLFQNTVFKIMERRLWTAWRAGRDVKTVIGVIRHQDIKKTLQEMKDVGKLIFSAEKELKQNMIYDALMASSDEFGGMAVAQSMREIIISGGAVLGAGAVGLNIMPQVWHAPLLKAGTKAPTLAVNPFINAAFRTMGEREEAVEYDEEQDFIMTQFLKNWLRSSGYIPQTLNKMIRITKDDIPAIYKGSKWQYFFAVPAVGEH